MEPLYITTLQHPGQPRCWDRNRPEVAPGTTVWVITCRAAGSHFHYAYQSEEAAQGVLNRICGGNTPSDFKAFYPKTYRTLVDFNFTTAPPAVVTLTPLQKSPR